MDAGRVLAPLIVLIVTLATGLPSALAQVTKSLPERARSKQIDGQQYRLTWDDEFDGPQLDGEKWRHRLASGLRPTDSSLITTDNAFLDGQGHLALTLCALTKAELADRVTTREEQEVMAQLSEDAWIPALSHLTTRRNFVYGYHEVRFQLPLIPGPGFCFWFITHKAQATEIDVLEQTLYSRGQLVDYKSSTLHWYPGGYQRRNHQSLSYQLMRSNTDRSSLTTTDATVATEPAKRPYQPEPPRVIDHSTPGKLRKVYAVKDDFFRWDDGQFHTAALLWTPEKYVFYYDDQLVGTFETGLSDLPEPAILDLRCMDSLEKLGQCEGRNNPRTTPAKVLVDYYRVYQASKE